MLPSRWSGRRLRLRGANPPARRGEPRSSVGSSHRDAPARKPAKPERHGGTHARPGQPRRSDSRDGPRGSTAPRRDRAPGPGPGRDRRRSSPTGSGPPARNTSTSMPRLSWPRPVVPTGLTARDEYISPLDDGSRTIPIANRPAMARQDLAGRGREPGQVPHQRAQDHFDPSPLTMPNAQFVIANELGRLRPRRNDDLTAIRQWQDFAQQVKPDDPGRAKMAPAGPRIASSSSKMRSRTAASTSRSNCSSPTSRRQPAGPTRP